MKEASPLVWDFWHFDEAFYCLIYSPFIHLLFYDFRHVGTQLISAGLPRFDRQRLATQRVLRLQTYDEPYLLPCVHNQVSLRSKLLCCRIIILSYFHRCDVRNFQLSKSQKKVLKRLNKYLVEGLPLTEKSTCKIEEIEPGCHNTGDAHLTHFAMCRFY